MNCSARHWHAARVRLAPVVVAAVLCVGAPSCGPDSADNTRIGLTWSIAPEPARVGPAQFTCALWDSTAAQPLAGARLDLEGNMSHAGMRPVFATAHETAPGTYTADLQLTMAGDWFILLDIQLADGRTLHRQVDLKGVRPQ